MGLRRWDTDGGELEQGDFTQAERKGRWRATLPLGSEYVQFLAHIVSFWS